MKIDNDRMSLFDIWYKNIGFDFMVVNFFVNKFYFPRKDKYAKIVNLLIFFFASLAALHEIF